VAADDSVLLNRCRDVKHGELFAPRRRAWNNTIPSRRQFTRECLEETGYSVEPIRFCALMEEICLDPVIREQYAQYSHRCCTSSFAN
jgi:hypothetical protein